VGIVSARPGGGWQALDGTSMATAHVSGLAALLFEARPDRTSGQVERAILRSCRLGPAMRPDRAHRGVPDAVAALRLL
jgi:subtilisin family serine protease